MKTRSPDSTSNDKLRLANVSNENGANCSVTEKDARALQMIDGPNISSTACSSLDAPSLVSDNAQSHKKSPKTLVKSKNASETISSTPEKTKSMVYVPSGRLSTACSAWSCSSITIVVTLLSALMVFVISRSFLTRQLDPVGCSMSYMWPSFVKMSEFGTEYTRFASKYSLYLYREGGIDEDIRVKGVPVLFIPGNAGSYKQVRPLAGEAATYYNQVLQQDEQAIRAGKRPIDFFTVDFNEDITAFHGQTLLDQAEYLNEAISHILSLYHEQGRFLRDKSLPDPSSVIIVGHSMGGIVARTMLTLSNYQDNSINTIVTLAAPHARPPVSFDAEIVHTYKRINEYWRNMYSQKWANDNKLWHVTLISISGGGLDTVVPSDYSTLASLVPATHGFTVFTSTIPEVWTGMDHLAITWCNQLRQSIIRALYDVIDANRSSQTRPRAERMSAFKRRFLSGMEDSAERFLPQERSNTLLTLENKSDDIIPQGERLVIREFGRSERPKPYLMPIPPSLIDRKSFTLLTDQALSGPGASDQLDVLFCSMFPLHAGHSADLYFTLDLSGDGAVSTRLACKNAASDRIMVPSSRKENQQPFDNYMKKDYNANFERSPPFSFLQYDHETLAEYHFVAIIDKAAHTVPGWLLAEFSTKSDAIIQMDKTSLSLMLSGLEVSFMEKTIMTEIRIPSIDSSLLAYRVDLRRKSCGEGELFRPLLRQHIADPYESKWFVNVKNIDLSVHGVAPYIPPALKADSKARGLSLQIWTDPTCDSTVEVSIKVDLFGSTGKLWMRYRTIFAAFPLLVVSLVLRKQFQVYDHKGAFISFSESMDLCLRSSIPAMLLALTLLGMSFPQLLGETSVVSTLFGLRQNNRELMIDFTRNDLLLGSQDPFFCFLVPLFGFITVGVCVTLNYLILATTQLFAVTISTFAKMFFKSTERPNDTLGVSPIRRRIVITCVLLLLVSVVIPYQFVYIVLCVVQLVTCVRALSLARDTQTHASSQFHNYAHSVLMLMLWILPINIPTLVVWVHNLAVHWLTPFSSHHNVLSVMPYVLLVETLSTGHMIPRTTTWIRHVTTVMLFILAGVAAVYGVTYAYLLHHLVNILCAWLLAMHLLDVSRLRITLDSILGGERRDHSKKQP